MIIKRTIYPGKSGSKKWQKIYGDKLICVRYKYDLTTKKRMTTIELMVEEQDWQPKVTFIPKNKIVHVHIKYGEIELTRQVKSLGGR